MLNFLVASGLSGQGLSLQIVPLVLVTQSLSSNALFAMKRCLEAVVSGTITLNIVTIQTSVQTQKRFT